MWSARVLQRGYFCRMCKEHWTLSGPLRRPRRDVRLRPAKRRRHRRRALRLRRRLLKQSRRRRRRPCRRWRPSWRLRRQRPQRRRAWSRRTCASSSRPSATRWRARLRSTPASSRPESGSSTSGRRRRSAARSADRWRSWPGRRATRRAAGIGLAARPTASERNPRSRSKEAGLRAPLSLVNASASIDQ